MLNANQKSSLRATCQTVDESLDRVISLLDSSHPRSPFSQLVLDGTPIQHRVISDYVARVRKAMQAALETLGIPLTDPSRSSVWAAQMALLSSAIAMEEVRPKHLRGYGPIAAKDAEAVTIQVGKIHDLLDRMQEYLAQGPGGDLQSRLNRLGGATDEAELLRNLDLVVTKHGLIEFRGTLEMLLERMESATFEVAVFGRVSSGKSSLLDYILETDVLPIGVTPVTAVPTRIGFGAKPHATIYFAEDKPIVILPDQLFEYAAEQHNPANAKHVRRIEVELPARRLQQGITLVDTPGLGSLALVGAAESMAYLPRCDLGLVLIDSASTLLAEDIALVDLLHRAGATVQVLLSKADLLSDADRANAEEYVRRQLQKQIGVAVPTFSISVVGQSVSLCESWLKQSLLPQLAEHKQMTRDSLRRKIGGLRDAVITSLRNKATKKTSIRGSRDWVTLDSALVAAGLELEKTLLTFRESTRSLATLTSDLFDQIASRIAQSWSNGSDATHDPQSEIIRALAEASVQMAAERANIVRDAQQRLLEALQRASEFAQDGIATSPLVQLADMPLPAQKTVPQVTLQRTWRGMLGAHSFAQNLRKQLEAPLQHDIETSLKDYAKRLDHWCLVALQELQRAYTARSDLVRAAAGDLSSSEADPSQIENDIAILEGAAHKARAI